MPLGGAWRFSRCGAFCAWLAKACWQTHRGLTGSERDHPGIAALIRQRRRKPVRSGYCNDYLSSLLDVALDVGTGLGEV